MKFSKIGHGVMTRFLKGRDFFSIITINTFRQCDNTIECNTKDKICLSVKYGIFPHFLVSLKILSII